MGERIDPTVEWLTFQAKYNQKCNPNPEQINYFRTDRDVFIWGGRPTADDPLAGRGGDVCKIQKIITYIQPPSNTLTIRLAVVLPSHAFGASLFSRQRREFSQGRPRGSTSTSQRIAHPTCSLPIHLPLVQQRKLPSSAMALARSLSAHCVSPPSPLPMWSSAPPSCWSRSSPLPSPSGWSPWGCSSWGSSPPTPPSLLHPDPLSQDYSTLLTWRRWSWILNTFWLGPEKLYFWNIPWFTISHPIVQCWYSFRCWTATWWAMWAPSSRHLQRTSSEASSTEARLRRSTTTVNWSNKIEGNISIDDVLSI